MAAAIVGLVLVAGCRTIGPLRGTDLPRDAQLVGGGFQIEWTAPADGTVYLFEKESGKIVETKSLEQGDSYEFVVDAEEDTVKAFESVLGVPMKDAKLVLYFKPSPSESETP